MKSLVYIIVGLILIVGCAQQSALSGGEKDIAAPSYVVVTTFPEYGATHFSSDKIEIGFDEFIRLKNGGKDVVITPFLKVQPTYEVKGKKIIIRFSETLDENTTYTLNFGNSISDITEGNKIPNFSYVFSTGEELDSLKFAGSVYHAFSKKPVEGAVVGLYQSINDSVAIHEKPYYFTTTNARGAFKLENIKEGTYQVIALNDRNNNLKYDPYSDEIAFLDSDVNVVYDTLNRATILNVFKEVQDKKWIDSKGYKSPGSVNLIFNKVIDSVSVQLLNNTFIEGGSHQTFFNEDSVRFWLGKITDKEQLKFVTSITTDTMTLNLRQEEVDSVLKFKTNMSNGLPYHQPIEFAFKTPIETIDKKLIRLLDEDSVLIPFEFDHSSNRILFDAHLKEDVSYEMWAYPNAFKGYYGATNDTIHLYFNLIPSNKYGQLILNYERQDKQQHIIQLLKNETVLEEVLVLDAKKEVVFKDLTPGAYQLRVVVDQNKNARWDPGVYSKKVFPEPVFLFEDKIELKAGWDLDLTWKN
ncbi:MAG: Ig-like domain-containing protein [Flavobacteriales bacterium]|nr:Ig-like domain-containing protein [Flavobacteriales bacterium]